MRYPQMRKRSLLLAAGACLATLTLTMGSALADPPVPPRADSSAVSAACGENYQPGVIRVNGDVNTPTTLTAAQIQSLPGQQTLHITYLNHLGVAQTHSETGPLLWTALNVAAGGIKVPPPTRNQYPEQPSIQTTLYVIVVATDGFQTVVSEGEIDPGFANAPILLAYAEDGVALSKVPYTSTENKGPAQLVAPTDIHGGRYANQICRIKVVSAAL